MKMGNILKNKISMLLYFYSCKVNEKVNGKKRTFNIIISEFLNNLEVILFSEQLV